MASSAAASRTTVVNIRRDNYDIYIGRANPAWRLPESPFANKFVIGRDGDRAEVIAKYRAWIATQPHLLAMLEDLRGKRLGCWCKPADCHGDVLVELLEGPPAPAPVQQALF